MIMATHKRKQTKTKPNTAEIRPTKSKRGKMGNYDFIDETNENQFQTTRFQKVKKPNHWRIPKRRIETINTRINRFKFFTEIIIYNEPFTVGKGKQDFNWVDTESGEIISVQKKSEFLDEMEIADYASRGEILEINYDGSRSEHESERRAKDNFYGFALCNDWAYFCTFTIAKNEHKSDDENTKKYWKMFREKLQYKHPDIKILAVPERHQQGNIHFHALLGNANLDTILLVAVNPHTKEPIFRKGRQVYNLPLWDKGFSTIVKIDTADIESQLKTINYMIEYVTKDLCIGAFQKRYYRTKNLDFKQTETKLSITVVNVFKLVCLVMCH